MPSYIQTGENRFSPLSVSIPLIPDVYDSQNTISRYRERIQSKYQMQEK